ncbi:MAG: flagellar hook protein FlgE [Tissierellia bacterium]|nr:flagellar hook protein FlgE [Tissierellia bacterium]
MMRSMYSGVSGLRVHQNKMDVISNNIANVNTIAYKRGTMTFQEVFSQVIRGASAPQDGRGGTNPQQIGLGVSVGSINTIHTKGPAQRTDNPEDLMIDGEGFFVVSADPNFENRYYTRAGNFTLDRDGNLVTADGYKVLGYLADEDGNITSQVGGIQINRSETVGATTTKKIEIRGNLDSRTPAATDPDNPDDENVHYADTVIKDSLGNSYTVTFRFVKDEDPNTWLVDIVSVKGADEEDFETNPSNVPIEITFADNGKLDEDSTNSMILTITKAGVSFGDDDGNITIDFSQLTQYANEMDAKPYAVDGNSSGKLEGYAIDASGIVVGIFTNGERKALAQIMLAKFDNPMGLQKIGGNLFVDTRNSGEPQLGRAGSSGYGPIAPGTLEMSNVDLSLEFTEMITTQRGFQANSRIITTSDEMLQELVNMKR